VGDMIGVKS